MLMANFIASPAPTGPAVLQPPAQLIEQRLGARGVSGLRTHQADQLALARRSGRAADRAFDVGGALGPHFLGQPDLHVGQHRAHLDHKLAPDIAGEQPAGPP